MAMDSCGESIKGHSENSRMMNYLISLTSCIHDTVIKVKFAKVYEICHWRAPIILRQSYQKLYQFCMQRISSHGKPRKIMEFHFFFRPGTVMEIDSRFWKIHKKSWKIKGILSRNGVVPFFHPAFQYKDTFM